MKKIQQGFQWFLLFCKRLLKKKSFIFLLCLIPLMIPVTNAALSGKSGVVHILLCNAGESQKAEEIIASLTEKNSSIVYMRDDSVENAEKAVETQEVQAAWVFSENFDELLKIYDNKKIPFLWYELLKVKPMFPFDWRVKFFMVQCIPLFPAPYTKASYIPVSYRKKSFPRMRQWHTMNMYSL